MKIMSISRMPSSLTAPSIRHETSGQPEMQADGFPNDGGGHYSGPIPFNDLSTAAGHAAGSLKLTPS